jgi:Flp pilus assembly protein TadD
MGCVTAKLGEVDVADQNYRQAQALDPRYATRQ